MNQSQNEQELITVKLRSLESEAQKKVTLETAVPWFIKYGLAHTLSNVPRWDHLHHILSITSKDANVHNAIFKSQQVVLDLLDQCRELYDIAFVIEQHEKIVGTWTAGALVHKLYKRFVDIFQGQSDVEEIMYLQGINMLISLSQSSQQEPAVTFLGPHFHRQRKQAGKVYEFVFKPLFQKKDLKAYYMRLIGLAGWLVFMEARVDVVAHLAKKLDIFVLYHKNEDSLQMLSVCNSLFDWLSVRFPREANLNHSNFAALIVKLRSASVRFDKFFSIWIQNRLTYIKTLDFQFMFRSLTNMGFGSLVLELLAKFWTAMKNNRSYEVLLKVFSGYIRKEFLSLWLQRGEQLQKYLKIAKYFMVGLCNRQRFEGQEIDSITNNLCRHLIIRNINFLSCYKQIIQFYALYENRFSYLSETSKRFLHEIKEKFNATIQTTSLHQIFQTLTIRDLTGEDEEQQYWQKGKVSFRYRGLENMGNTCYINSFVQCLFMTKKVRAFINQLTKDNSLPSSNITTYSLNTLFEELIKKEIKQPKPFFPDVFRMMLPVPFNDTFEQQDTAQFGRVYLQQLVKQMDKDIGKRLQKLLFQKLKKIFRCTKCGNTKDHLQSVFDIILSVERTDNELFISKLLQKYFSPQMFSGQNQVHCSKCDVKQDVVSELVPEKMSEVVVFTLNLFDYTDKGIKVLTPLIFQFTLNFDVLLKTKDLGEYELYAFILHLGSSLGGGHYICYVRNLEENLMVWYCMDDGYVTEREIGRPQEFEFTANETPYMLFYSKKQAGRGKHS